MSYSTGTVNEPIDAVGDRVETVTITDDAPRPNILFTFAFGSWEGSAARNFSFPEDRFAQALLADPRVRRALVCDDFRSAPRKLARTLLGRNGAQFPPSEVATHHSPLRLRRQHPVDLGAVKRVYAAYERSIRRAAKRHGLERPVIVTTNPFLAGFGEFSWAGPVTFFGRDEFGCAGPPGAADAWWENTMEAYRQIRAKRRRVVAVNQQLIDRIDPAGLHAVAPNGVDATEWQRLPAPADWFAALPSPRLLYVGALESRVDVEQIRQVADEFADGSVTLVGPLAEPKHFEPLRGISNIHIHPPVPRAEVVGLIGHADVGLVPHVRNLGTEAMSPLKLYEYLAGGLPAAAVDLAGVVGISRRVVLVPPDGDMPAAVRRALALGRDREEDRLAFVARHSWERRIDVLFDVALAPA